MNDDLLLERRLRVALQAMPPVPSDLLASALVRAAATTQRHRWRDRLRPVRPAWAAAATLTAVVAIAGAALTATQVPSSSSGEGTVGEPPSAGTWGGHTDLPGGNWSYGTSTRLLDGRVLILGFDSGAMRAQIWDPDSNGVTEGGTGAGDTREGHSATLLPDGRVLITGGLHGAYSDPDPVLDTAVTWDPRTGLFKRARPLNTRRSGHLATRLTDGRVLILGGGDMSAEVWESDGSGFVPLDERSALDSFSVATLLADGRVLVLGYGDSDTRCTEVWRVGPRVTTIEGPFEGGCGARTATLLPDDRVQVSSSSGRDAPLGAEASREVVQVFDPDTDTYTAAGSLTATVDRSTAVALADGRVLLAGGYGADGQTTAAAETWDPVTASFARAGTMTTPRSDPDATLLQDGRVLVVGGWDVDIGPDGGESGQAIRSLEVFDPR